MYRARLLTGTIFCVTAAVLYAINYVAAILYIPAIHSWSGTIVDEAYTYVGRDLQWAAACFLVAGLIYLIQASRFSNTE